MAADTDKQSFWEHLDVLRAAIVKSLLVAVVFGVAAFCFKEELFAVILAPKDADFITYRLLYSLGGLVTESGAPDFLVKLINTGLAGQFIIHMKPHYVQVFSVHRHTSSTSCFASYRLLYMLMSGNMWCRWSEAAMLCSPWVWRSATF